MKIQLPPKRHASWLPWGVFGAVSAAMFISIVLRLATGRAVASLLDFVQSVVALSMLFSIYFALFAVAGFFGYIVMAKIMLGGFSIATVVMVYFAWRDRSGWGGLAAVAAFFQLIVLAIVGGALAEGYVWFRKRQQRRE